MVLVKTVLYEGLDETASISALFPGLFPSILNFSLSLPFLSLSLLIIILLVLCSQLKLILIKGTALLLLFSRLSQESQRVIIGPHCQKHVRLELL